MTKQGTGRLTKAIIETADGMRRADVMDEAAHAEITRRHPGNGRRQLPEKERAVL